MALVIENKKDSFILCPFSRKIVAGLPPWISGFPNHGSLNRFTIQYSWRVGRPTLNLNLNLNQKAVGYPYNICATISYSLLTLWKCTFSFLFIFVFIYTIILSHFFHISTRSWFPPRPRLVNSQFKPREAVRTSAAQGGDFADRQTDRLRVYLLSGLGWL